MDDLRSWWEVPSIAHYCSLFRSAFDLTDFDIEDLEEAFIESEKDGGSEFLLDIVRKLLNGCYGRKDITSQNFDIYVKDLIKYKWEGSDNAIAEKTEFSQLILREKVEFLHALCECRLDSGDVFDLLKGFEGDNMRVEPLGKDRNGATYWYFYGSRLYMEDPLPKQELTKEQKRKKENERKRELMRQKRAEKKQHKIEKEKRKLQKKEEKKLLLEEKLKQENKKGKGSSLRRSGRIKVKQELEIDSSSSSTESSSPEESTEESSSEEEESEEEEEQEEETPKKCPGRKTPARKNSSDISKCETSKTPMNTRRSGKRSIGNRSTSSTPVNKSERPDPNIRRSGRIRNRREVRAPPPLPQPTPSNTDEDSGHGSGDSGDDAKSEVSKYSTRSNDSKKSTSDSRSRPRPMLSSRAVLQTSNKDTVSSVKDEEADKLDNGDFEDKEPLTQVDDDADLENDDCTRRQKKIIGPKKTAEVKAESTVENSEMEDLDKQEENGSADVNNGGEPSHENTDNPVAESNKVTMDASDLSNEIKDSTDMSDETKPGDTQDGDTKTDDTVPIENNHLQNDSNNDHVEAKTVKAEPSEINQDTEQKDAENDDKTNVEVDKTNVEVDKSNAKDDSSDKKDIDSVKEENAENTEVAKDGDDQKNSETDNLPEKPAVAPTPSPSTTRWHLVCSVLEEWENLARWFQDSPVRCEKSLSKIIREDFLPMLPEIIEAREKEKKKRLQELETRRRSERITFKQREKMEQERILAEALLAEEKARIQAEDERKLREEQLRLEEENRQREERLKAREERAKRLSMREERARLIAEGKEIPPELLYSGAQAQKEESDSDDSRGDLKDDQSYDALMKIIDAMKVHKDCWPFLEPVTDEQAPDYSEVIKRPMDISKIEKKVENKEYRHSQHFISDFKLMFNNCKRYNGQDSEFTECARNMEMMFKKYTRRFLSDNPSESNYYADRDFVASVRGMGQGTKKMFRPKRAASSRALKTVQKALDSDEEDSTDEEDLVEPPRKAAKHSPIKTPSHHTLLLQEMIELRRKRETKHTGSVQDNHKFITRGPEHIQIPNPASGVMIMPKEELPPTGVLRLAATREIKRKPPSFTNVDQTKKDPGLHVKMGSGQQSKTIRIVASNNAATGKPSVKETAETVKVSADGYLIIGGKNSGIKVSENTKIIIQPPGVSPSSGAPGSAGTGEAPPAGKEVIIKKIPAPQATQSVSQEQKTPAIVNAVRGTSFATSQNSVGSKHHSVDRPNKQQRLPEHQTSGIKVAGHTTSNLSPEMRKKQLDIAQRILMLSEQKRKLAQQQRQQQQNNVTSEGNPPKIPRLEHTPNMNSAQASQSHRSIEDRLKDPVLDSQLGNVSQKVVSSVNIASDILDSYYSVLNATQTTTATTQATSQPIVSVLSSHFRKQNPQASATIVPMNVQPLQGMSAKTGLEQSPHTANTTSGQSVACRTNPSITTPVNTVPRQVSAMSSIVNVSNPIKQPATTVNSKTEGIPSSSQAGVSLHTFMSVQNLPNVTALGLTTTSQTPVVQSSQNLPKIVQSPLNDAITPNQTRNPLPVATSIQNQQVLVSVQNLLNSSSMQKLLNATANIGKVEFSPKSPLPEVLKDIPEKLLVTTVSHTVSKSDISPIEALFSGQSSTSQIPNVVTTPANTVLSPNKINRENIFDKFNSDKPLTKEVNQIETPTDKDAVVDGKAGRREKVMPSMTHVGSPLKTLSVMEALRCKLQPVMKVGGNTGTPMDSRAPTDNETTDLNGKEAVTGISTIPQPHRKINGDWLVEQCSLCVTSPVVACNCTSPNHPACVCSNHCNYSELSSKVEDSSTDEEALDEYFRRSYEFCQKDLPDGVEESGKVIDDNIQRDTDHAMYSEINISAVNEKPIDLSKHASGSYIQCGSHAQEHHSCCQCEVCYRSWHGIEYNDNEGMDTDSTDIEDDGPRVDDESEDIDRESCVNRGGNTGSGNSGKKDDVKKTESSVETELSISTKDAEPSLMDVPKIRKQLFKSLNCENAIEVTDKTDAVDVVGRQYDCVLEHGMDSSKDTMSIEQFENKNIGDSRASNCRSHRIKKRGRWSLPPQQPGYLIESPCRLVPGKPSWKDKPFAKQGVPCSYKHGHRWFTFQLLNKPMFASSNGFENHEQMRLENNLVASPNWIQEPSRGKQVTGRSALHPWQPNNCATVNTSSTCSGLQSAEFVKLPELLYAPLSVNQIEKHGKRLLSKYTPEERSTLCTSSARRLSRYTSLPPDTETGIISGINEDGSRLQKMTTSKRRAKCRRTKSLTNPKRADASFQNHFKSRLKKGLLRSVPGYHLSAVRYRKHLSYQEFLCQESKTKKENSIQQEKHRFTSTRESNVEGERERCGAEVREYHDNVSSSFPDQTFHVSKRSKCLRNGSLSGGESSTEVFVPELNSVGDCVNQHSNSCMVLDHRSSYPYNHINQGIADCSAPVDLYSPACPVETSSVFVEDCLPPNFLSNLFPSDFINSNGDGIYSDTDPDLEQIENDIFDLQETYCSDKAQLMSSQPAGQQESSSQFTSSISVAGDTVSSYSMVETLNNHRDTTDLTLPQINAGGDMLQVISEPTSTCVGPIQALLTSPTLNVLNSQNSDSCVQPLLSSQSCQQTVAQLPIIATTLCGFSELDKDSPPGAMFTVSKDNVCNTSSSGPESSAYTDQLLSNHHQNETITNDANFSETVSDQMQSPLLTPSGLVVKSATDLYSDRESQELVMGGTTHLGEPAITSPSLSGSGCERQEEPMVTSPTTNLPTIVEALANVPLTHNNL